MAIKQKEEKMSEFKMTTVEEMEAATNVCWKREQK